MSSDVTVVLPDGSERTLGPDATGADLATDLGGRAAKDALIAIANGIQLDLCLLYTSPSPRDRG